MSKRPLKAGLFWLISSLILASACSLNVTSPATTVVNKIEQAEPNSLSNLIPLIPETATFAADPFVENLKTMTPRPVKETAVPTPLQTTPTFAAYGITHTIGTSFQNRPLVAHRFGYGTHTIVIVGGIHGGYEWNTIILSYQLIDYFRENSDEIPHDLSLYIIPSANPDGQYRVTQTEGPINKADILFDSLPGRFNGNDVDLNRNWSCDWEAVGYWGAREVDAGERPFSEPETLALSKFFVGQKADVVIFLHSASNGIYIGGCPQPLPQTQTLMAAYSQASKYPAYQDFSSYPITGDASDWLATQGIASFSVELAAHSQIEFEENLAGVKALINFFSQK